MTQRRIWAPSARVTGFSSRITSTRAGTSGLPGAALTTCSSCCPASSGYTEARHNEIPNFAGLLNEPPSVFWEPTQNIVIKLARRTSTGRVCGLKLVRRLAQNGIWCTPGQGSPWSSWAEVQREFTGDAARDHYNAQWAIKAIREGQQTLPPNREWLIDDALSGTREDYVAAAEERAGVPYAVVSMASGWNADEDDQKTDADWNKPFPCNSGSGPG